MLRVRLKLELPIMDTGTTDPTVTETRIPWLIHDFPDDRQQGYALAEYIFKQKKLKGLALFARSRAMRVSGSQKFFDEAKRLGHTPALEIKFERGDQDFATQFENAAERASRWACHLGRNGRRRADSEADARMPE